MDILGPRYEHLSLQTHTHRKFNGFSYKKALYANPITFYDYGWCPDLGVLISGVPLLMVVYFDIIRNCGVRLCFVCSGTAAVCG